MDKLPITENEIKDILRQRNNRIAAIQEKIYTIDKDIKNTESIIEMVSFRRPEISDMPRGKGNHTDLGDTYLNYREILEQRTREYNKLLYEMIREEICIERVWQCYLLLGEPYFTILTDLYVKNEKYIIVEQESGYSRQVFEGYRKNGIELILEFYNSSKSAAELAEGSIAAEIQRSREKHKKESDKENYQISMEDIMENFK